MNARKCLAVLLACSALFLDGCATLQGDPLQVTVVGIEPLQGEGMELRLMVKLRVQNPNDAPLDYHGVALQMDVQGKTLASGVSDSSGTVPGFGETVITVPVSISAYRMVRQAIGMATNRDTRKITYDMKGKLSAGPFATRRFTTHGDFELPAPDATPTIQ
ncbi:MAG TPA: LEA type 2 family protein [Steroidobacteraceae bacterium]|nr:LEA type 2 family protein [Steroidobacteraceae bacterium]